MVVLQAGEMRAAVYTQAGDTLYTASMVPIMTFLEDSGPGVHDTTAAACSYGLYVLQIGEVAPCSSQPLAVVVTPGSRNAGPAWWTSDGCRTGTRSPCSWAVCCDRYL